MKSTINELSVKIHTKIFNTKSFTRFQAGLFSVFIAIITVPQFGSYPEVLSLHTTLSDGPLEEGLTAISFCCVNVTNATFLQGMDHGVMGIATPVGST